MIDFRKDPDLIELSLFGFQVVLGMELSRPRAHHLNITGAGAAGGGAISFADGSDLVISGSITSGDLGGLLAARTQAVNPAINQLGQIATALSADPAAEAFFAKLSSSLQRYHVDNINAAKTAETRQRRIDKAISLFRQGKQR